jgi:DNA-binding response OmpR family regulator
LAAGAREYLTKPLDLQKFLAVVAELLSKRVGA